MILTKGKFKIVEVSPWKMEVIEGLDGHEQHTGLPFVTPDKWNCVGATPTEADLGKVFEFEGYIPAMGGVYGFATDDEKFHFRSKWSMPFPTTGPDAVGAKNPIEKLTGADGRLMLAVLVLVAGGVLVWVTGRKRAGGAQS